MRYQFICVGALLASLITNGTVKAQAGSQTFTPTGPVIHPYEARFMVPATATSVTIECFGSAGYLIDRGAPPGTVWGGMGGGAYASSTFALNANSNRTIKIEIDARETTARCQAIIKAAAGQGPNLVTATQGGLGGQAAASSGQIVFSGGNGGNSFYNAAVINRGGDGGAASAAGNGVAGTAGTAMAAGASGAPASGWGTVKITWK